MTPQDRRTRPNSPRLTLRPTLAWLGRVWAEYVEYHRSTPITITHAGILGPIPPEWHNQPKTT